MKLLLDSMLGNLLTWLRLLGYDTEYWKHGDDEALIREALREHRIIITRDSQLYIKAVQAGLKGVIIESPDTVSALVQLAERIGIDVTFNPLNTRCPDCNTPLSLLKKTPNRWLCGGCGKEYWIGRHWRNIGKVLEEVSKRLRGHESRH